MASADTELKDKVKEIKDFIGDNETKLEILKDIIEYEENNPKDNDTFLKKDIVEDSYWVPGKHVAMQPTYIGMFKNAPFVNIVLDTNSQTLLCLENRQLVKQAVEEIDDEAEKWSQEWLKQQLGGNKIDKALSDVEVTEDDKEEIEQITDEVDALDYWSKFVAPTLKHRDVGKKVTLIILASPQDQHGTKGRVNMMIYGPPGTGKSVIKNYLVDKFDAESIDGPRVSKADITYNKSSGEFGQLPKAHKGMLVVEESDEMDEGPLGAALTSLGESGKIEIRDREIPAEVRGIFLSNFMSVEESIQQWSRESVNRFDFKVKFNRLSEDEKSSTIDWHYEYFRKPKPSENEDMLLKYLKLARAHDPTIEDMESIKEFKAENVDEIENVRVGLSVMNIAWIIARLNLDDVKLDHYKQAFKLVTEEQDG